MQQTKPQSESPEGPSAVARLPPSFTHAVLTATKVFQGILLSPAQSGGLLGRSTITLSQNDLKVRNGKSIDVWTDRWVPNNFGGLIIPTDSSNRFTPLLVADVIDASGNWNITHLEPFLNGDDAKAIKSIPIGNENDRDVLIWPFSKSGVYSAKSGYRRIVKEQGGKGSSKPSSSHMIDAKVWKVVWRPAMISKISNFLWRALSNALSTNWNIFRRKIIPDPMCALCGEHPETTEHCLLLCPWTSVVWFGSSLVYILENAFITSLDAWLLAVYNNSSKLSHHNEEFFQFVPLDEPRRSTASKLWHPPLPNVVKVNIDAAWKTSNHNSGIGLVVCNHRGCSIAGASLLCSHNSVVEAEADSVVKGLQIARFLNLKNVIIEGDCHEVPREANQVADSTAKLATVRLCSLDWANTPPTSLLHILKRDDPSN
ncbi:hypothetical protein ACLB2K_020070 [Fragaria x ananassa]